MHYLLTSQYLSPSAWQFKHMPFDTQICPIRLTSFRNLGTDLTFHVPNGTDIGPAYDFTRLFPTPVRAICPEAGTVEWTLTSVTGASSDGNNLALVATSFIEYVFVLTRERSFYTENIIMPLILLMCICWTSFFVPRGAVPARVSMVVVAFLTITNQIRSTNQELPKLQATVWLLQLQSITQLMVFASIIEYGVVTYVCRLQSRIEQSIGIAQNQIQTRFDHAKGSANDHYNGVQQATREVAVNVEAIAEGVAEDVTQTTRALKREAGSLSPNRSNDSDRPSPKDAESTKLSRMSFRRQPPGANGKLLSRRHRRHHARLDLAHDVAQSIAQNTNTIALSAAAVTNTACNFANTMGLSAAHQAYEDQSLAAAERHELQNHAASLHHIRLATQNGPAVEITKEALLGELRAMLGVPENFLLLTVIQAGKGGIWIPMFRITCDRLDVYSRYVFFLVCEQLHNLALQPF